MLKIRRRARTNKNSSISTISCHASPRGGFLFHAPTARHSLSSPASGMVNHDAPHSTERPPQQLVTLAWIGVVKGYSRTQILTRIRAGGDQKKLRSRGGFEAVSPLSHMNRQNMNTPEKTKTETKP